MGGYKRWVGRWREFCPSRLENEQALCREALGPGAATCSILLNFFRLVDRHSSFHRHATRWAGLGNSVNCDELCGRTISNSGNKRDGKKHICKERSNIFFLVRLREAQRRREHCITCKIFVCYSIEPR